MRFYFFLCLLTFSFSLRRKTVDLSGSALTKSAQSDADALNVNKFDSSSLMNESTGAFEVGGANQWVLLEHDVIGATDNIKGWSSDKRIECFVAGITLVGPFGTELITRSYTDLPPHSEIRIRANFHFVDGWLGETGFMKASVGTDGRLVYIWSDQHAQDMAPNGYDMCGRVEVPEGKFYVPIDAVVPHNSDEFTIAFGSTMDVNNPSGAFWGISGVELYIH